MRNSFFLIFGLLFTFGALIEFAQEYLNVLLERRIHGNFNPIDLKYDLLGLVCFMMLWMVFIAMKIKTSNNRV